jgi:hypothetical protein
VSQSMTTQSDPAVPAETARSTPDIELHLNDTTVDKPVLRNGIRCIRRSARPCRWPSPPQSPGRPLPVPLADEEGRGFSKAHGPNVIRYSTQTLQLRAFIGIKHPGSTPSAASRARRTQRPSNCSPTPISAATFATGRRGSAPETPGCTSYACPTCGQPSRRTSGPTSRVSALKGQPQAMGVMRNWTRT